MGGGLSFPAAGSGAILRIMGGQARVMDDSTYDAFVGGPGAVAVPPGQSAGSIPRLEVQTAQTVAEFTQSVPELDRLTSITFNDPRPGPGTPLVINVSGNFDGSMPNLAGVSSANTPYMLWNFPDATDLEVENSDSLEGTIYAPRADLEVHDFPFRGVIDCEPATQPTTEPTTEPTTQPTTGATDVGSGGDEQGPGSDYHWSSGGGGGTGLAGAGGPGTTLIAAGGLATSAGLLLSGRSSARRPNAGRRP